MPYLISYNHEYQYIKNTVFFEDDIKYHYRKGKRVVLGYLSWLYEIGSKITPKGFQKFLVEQWPRMETVNTPLPYYPFHTALQNAIANDEWFNREEDECSEEFF